MQNRINLEAKADERFLTLHYIIENYMTSGSNFLVYQKLWIIQLTSAILRLCIL